MAGTQVVDIARARAADRQALGEVLARAFQDDPVLAWVVPDADRRRERLPAVFDAFAGVYLPHEESYVAAGAAGDVSGDASGDAAGAALWAPPGADPLSGETLEWFGEQMAAILEDDAARASEISAILDEHHPDQASFHLQFMGVVPERQGGGIGSRLLTTVLGRCDASGVPAYLEATSVDNRRLYERHGFEVLREIRLPDGPPLWAMWRDPRPS